MNIDDVKNIAVIGAGNMGHQIATLCAIRGYKTKCTDVVDEILKKAEAFVDNYLPGRVKKGRGAPHVPRHLPDLCPHGPILGRGEKRNRVSVFWLR